MEPNQVVRDEFCKLYKKNIDFISNGVDALYAHPFFKYLFRSEALSWTKQNLFYDQDGNPINRFGNPYQFSEMVDALLTEKRSEFESELRSKLTYEFEKAIFDTLDDYKKEPIQNLSDKEVKMLTIGTILQNYQSKTLLNRYVELNPTAFREQNIIKTMYQSYGTIYDKTLEEVVKSTYSKYVEPIL